MLQLDHEAPILLVGGGGVVGRRLAPLLTRFEARPLLIAGRSRERAAATIGAVQALGGEASFAALDLAGPVGTWSVAAVICLVNDPQDKLLLAAVGAGVPFVDITRWTTRLASAVARVTLAEARAPVVLASGWMGGLLPRVAALLAGEIGGAIDSVDGAVRYALADASGADSIEYIDRLWIPFDVTLGGRAVTVSPLSEARCVSVAGRRTIVRRFDTPEQWSLPLTLGASSVAVRLGFDHALAGTALAFLSRIGFFRWFAAERFRALRHALLRTKGAEHRSGAPAAFRVDVTNTDGVARGMSLSTADGQAGLTAVGAWLAARFALSAATPAGVSFPEQDPDNASLLQLLQRAGVTAVRGSP